ncbi:hypothetical protein [Aquimarina sp. RZ0]|uniref:hypothetical protein n=1 Tax=Aquimarina sp. RZ0 TaxID=2607730 RepID=UPI0011F3AC3D|nr:hypothetical protein [Aquimarina sp. RZ0]KAA1244708.1 hypothetical protein F0000_15145 [Aquimarina sp. RZ0]
MKTFFKSLGILFLISIFISCEVNEYELVEENEIELSNNNINIEKTISDPECTRIVGSPDPVCFTGDREYSVRHSFGDGAAIRWSIRSGNGVFIIGSATSNFVTIRFTSQFRGGEIQVIVGNCTSILELSSCGVVECPPNTAPARPGAITFDIFLGSRPNNGDFCTNTVSNALWVSNVECAVDYIWTISPSGFGIKLEKSPVHPATALVEVNQPGEYIVSVKAVSASGLISTARSISLIAENCNNGGIF